MAKVSLKGQRGNTSDSAGCWSYSSALRHISTHSLNLGTSEGGHMPLNLVYPQGLDLASGPELADPCFNPTLSLGPSPQASPRRGPQSCLCPLHPGAAVTVPLLVLSSLCRECERSPFLCLAERFSSFKVQFDFPLILPQAPLVILYLYFSKGWDIIFCVLTVD